MAQIGPYHARELALSFFNPLRCACPFNKRRLPDPDTWRVGLPKHTKDKIGPAMKPAKYIDRVAKADPTLEVDENGPWIYFQCLRCYNGCFKNDPVKDKTPKQCCGNDWDFEKYEWCVECPDQGEKNGTEVNSWKWSAEHGWREETWVKDASNGWSLKQENNNTSTADINRHHNLPRTYSQGTDDSTAAYVALKKQRTDNRGPSRNNFFVCLLTSPDSTSGREVVKRG